MELSEFRANVEAALRRSQQDSTGATSDWLNETVLAGMAESGLEKLPADVGFAVGSAAARFRRIAREVAETNDQACPEQVAEAAAALATIAEVLRSLRTTN
jgi:hypothetical protein